MLTTNYNIRSTTKKDSPIYLVCRWSKNRISYSIGERVEVKNWYTDPKIKKYNSPKPAAGSTLIEMLKKRDAAVHELFRVFKLDNDREPSQDEFKYLLDVYFDKVPPVSFFEQYELFIKQSGESGAHIKATTTRHNQSMNILRRYKPGLTFNDITILFYDEFINWMAGNGYSLNYVAKHCKSLKAFLRWSGKRGLYKHLDLVEHMKNPSQKTDKSSLTLDQVKAIIALDIDSKPLDRIRDLLLVGVFTGLRVSDLMDIRPENIKKDHIEKVTQKTGEVVIIPLHPEVERIIKKYDGKLPDPVAPQYYNREVKAVCKLVKSYPIEDDSITSHATRRTFATLCVEYDWLTVPQIMNIGGWKSEAVFWAYVQRKPKTDVKAVQNKMRESWEA